MYAADNQLATIAMNNSEKKYKPNFLFLIFMLALAVIVVISNKGLSNLSNDTPFLSGLFVCAFVFFSAFIYEVCSISLLDRIGYEEKKSGVSGMVTRTYGLMGLGSAIGYWTLGLMDQQMIIAFITLLICLFAATMSVLKRHSVLFVVNKLSV